jgi:hypothetical protein
MRYMYISVSEQHGSNCKASDLLVYSIVSWFESRLNPIILTEAFRDYFSGKFSYGTSIRPATTSLHIFPYHYSLMIVPVNVVQSILIALLNKSHE